MATYGSSDAAGFLSGVPSAGGTTGRVTSGIPDTGHLRRRYDFSERFTELAIDQTPFFRLVAKVAKKPTDDPQFKYTEKRGSIHKRYAYVVGYRRSDDSDMFNNSTLQTYESSSTPVAAGNTIKLWVATDFKNKGNKQNVYNQSSGAINVGVVDTAPEFFLPNQIVKVNVSATDGGDATVSDYALVRVTAVGSATDISDTNNTGGSGAGNILANCVEAVLLTCTVVKGVSSGYLTSFSSDAPDLNVYAESIAGNSAGGGLEAKRCHVVGSAYAEGSGLINQSWNDNPYSTSYGQTQIFRSEFAMTNTARATALKYEPNEWARIWRDKLIEHKWDMEQAALFSAQGSSGSGTSSVYYTQGAVDFVTNSGNSFSIDYTSKTTDDFLDDMSNYLDPRYNNGAASVYFCDTATHNWLLRLGNGSQNGLTDALFQNSLSVTNARWDFAVSGKKSLFGVPLTTISTPYGDINVTRCISLDSSNVKILGINMKYVKYRPLVGNGINRDTSVYVGVKSLEHTGDDKRTDMILTEGGFEWQMPEAHAYWT
jgi:hypothetical protein